MSSGHQVEIVKVEREMSAEQFLVYAYDQIEKATTDETPEFAHARLAALALTVEDVAKQNFVDTNAPMKLPVTEARATDTTGNIQSDARAGGGMFPTPPAGSNQGPTTGASSFAKRIEALSAALDTIDKAVPEGKAEGDEEGDGKKKPPWMKGDDADKAKTAKGDDDADAEAKAKADAEAKAKAKADADKVATAKADLDPASQDDAWPDDLNAVEGEPDWGVDPGFEG